MKLKLGLRVTNGEVRGTVVKPGPYGDQPFQIKGDNGVYYSFIEEDGSAAYSKHIVWKPIDFSVGYYIRKHNGKLKLEFDKEDLSFVSVTELENGQVTYYDKKGVATTFDQDIGDLISPVCNCSKEKFGFAGHAHYCPIKNYKD